jgi:hypothetical protein
VASVPGGERRRRRARTYSCDRCPVVAKRDRRERTPGEGGLEEQAGMERMGVYISRSGLRLRCIRGCLVALLKFSPGHIKRLTFK